MLQRVISLFLPVILLAALAAPAFAEQPTDAGQRPVYVFSPKGKLEVFEDAGTGSPTGLALAPNQDAVLLETLGDRTHILFWNEAGDPITGYVKTARITQRQPEESPGIAALVSDEGQRIPLYQKKNTKGAILGRYYPGVQVQILGRAEKGWVRVRLHALEGYVKEENLDMNLQNLQPVSLPQVTVQYAKASSLTLRAADSYKSAKLSAVKNGEAVRVLGVGREFAHVITENGLVGFMMAAGLFPQPLFAEVAQTAPVPQPDGIITVIDNPGGQGANLRARASSAGDALGLYPNGTRVVVTGGTAWWKKVWVDGKTGYMMAKLLKGFEPAEGGSAQQDSEPMYDWSNDGQYSWSTGETGP